MSATASTSAGFGFSTAESTSDAVSEAVASATEKLGSGAPSIAFISSTVTRDVEEVRTEFVKALPNGTPIHGITSSGAILTSSGCKSSGVGCLVVKSDDGAFATAYDTEDGNKAAASLKEKMPSPQAIFMGATPGAEEGIIAILSKEFPSVPVFGGTAADDELSGAWKVMSSETSSGTGISLVGIGDSVKFGASMLGPYIPTDKIVQATKTEGRRVFEIDGKPAADWAYEWLGEDVKDQFNDGGLVLPQTAQSPLGIKQPSGEYVTNHLASFGGAEKFIDFFAPIPEGSELVVMDSGDGPSTGYGAAMSNAYDSAKAMMGSDPSAGILVFCGGMAIAVGDNLDTGLTNKDFLSKVEGLPMMGMTCFGEQACLPETKTNVQRNLSVGMVLFG